MENIKLNTIVRLCLNLFQMNWEMNLFGNRRLLTLIIVQKPNSPWKYGYHLKSQGGGSFGEYHIVCRGMNMIMKMNETLGIFL